jgi:glycosyl transferase family 25
MEICYINLAERKDREAVFLKVNSHLTNLRAVGAVSGGAIDFKTLIEAGIVAGALPNFSAAALGNALSHGRVWQHCAPRGIGVTIAEDDAVFNCHFERKAAQVIAKLPVDWDVIFWGWNFDAHLAVEIIPGLKRSVMALEGSKLGEKIEDFKRLDFEVAPLRVLGLFGSVAYSASAKGVQFLASNCFPLRHELIPMSSISKAIWNCSLDVTMNKYFPMMKAYVCVPPLVWTENDKAVSDVFPAAAETQQKAANAPKQEC